MTRRQAIIATVPLLIAAGLLITFVIPAWIFHPLIGRGYQFWSGIAGSFLLGGGIWSGIAVTYWKHSCHAPGCLRIGRFHTADRTAVLCSKHHPDIPAGGRSLAEIHADHHAAKGGN